MILETTLPYDKILVSNGIYDYCYIVKKLAIFKTILLLEIINFDTRHCNVSQQSYLQVFLEVIMRKRSYSSEGISHLSIKAKKKDETSLKIFPKISLFTKRITRHSRHKLLTRIQSVNTFPISWILKKKDYLKAKIVIHLLFSRSG